MNDLYQNPKFSIATTEAKPETVVFELFKEFSTSLEKFREEMNDKINRKIGQNSNYSRELPEKNGNYEERISRLENIIEQQNKKIINLEEKIEILTKEGYNSTFRFSNFLFSFI